MEKLINHFGCKHLDHNILDTIHNLTVNDNNIDEFTIFSNLFLNNMIISHKDFDDLLNYYSHGGKFYIYTGRGPSSGSLHIGHLIPFLVVKCLQRLFDAPVYIQLSTDEKYLRDGLSLETVETMARSNASDIMSLGFDINKTVILSNFNVIKQLYPTTMNILRNTTVNQLRSTFGITEENNLGSFYFPAIEAAPAFPSALTGIIDNHPRCLVVLGIDQDPYFRIARDVASSLSQPKPSLLHLNFISGLKGLDTKMSSSDPDSTIFLSDSDKIIRKKIMSLAFSGGGNTIKEHKEKGADISIDVSCHYLRIFGKLAITNKLIHQSYDIDAIINKYASGELLTGQLKTILSDILSRLLSYYHNNKIDDLTLNHIMTPHTI